MKKLLLILTLFPLHLYAKASSGLDAVIEKSSGTPTKRSKLSSNPSPMHPSFPKISTPKKIVDIKIKKDKKGNLIVPWPILAEYNLKKKTVGMNLSKVVNKQVVMKGFMLPLDYSKKEIREFLLLPYVPSCMHVPPPSGNSIINVKMTGKSKMRPSYYPIEVIGTITIDTKAKSIDEFMPAGIYRMTAKSVKELK